MFKILRKRFRLRHFFIIIVVALLIIGGWYYFYYDVVEEDGNVTHDLEWYIDNGYSIMGFDPHCDDIEIFPSWIYTYSNGQKWVVSILALSEVLEQAQAEREMALQWFEQNYLDEYVWLDNIRPIDNDIVKQQLKDIIEEKKPDILLSFSPLGWTGHPEHITVTQILHELYDELSYSPEWYYFINIGQGPDSPSGPHYEQYDYPPTDVLDLDVYSEELGMTYWQAKREVWEHFRSSCPPLERYISSGEADQNDRKEYYRKAST